MKQIRMIHLSPLWSSGAVLQHGRPQQLSGTAPPQQRLQIILQSQHHSYQVDTHTDAFGAFGVEIPAQPPSGPWTLSISAETTNSKTLVDLWFGQRLLWAGQSNVGWPLRHYPAQWAELQGKLQATPGIATVRAYLTDAYQPVAADEHPINFRVAGRWQQLTPAQISAWPALLCHFVQHYQATAGTTAMMLGLVDISWPGAALDAWTQHADGSNATHPWQPGALFATRLKPWLQQPFAALIWYQGEQDAMGENAGRYGDQLQRWLDSSRQVAGWAFPLLLVQIAGFGQSALPALQHGFVQIRLAQQQFVATNSQCWLVSAADLGAADEIHPPQKAELARRLALCMHQQIDGLLLAQLLPAATSSQLREVVLQLPAADWSIRPQHLINSNGDPIDSNASRSEGATIGGFFTDAGHHGWQAVAARFSADRNQLQLQIPVRARLLVYGLMPNPVLTLYTAEGLPLLPQCWPLPEPAD